MHYYKFNIGDYVSATQHLEPLEDLAYRRMLDIYYLNEKPLPNDVEQVARLIRMRTHCECITNVLNDFFVLEEDGFHCNRVDVELFAFREKSEKAANSAKTRWNKSKEKQQVKTISERNANALKSQSECNANQEPRTNKQQTIKSFVYRNEGKLINQTEYLFLLKEYWNSYEDNTVEEITDFIQTEINQIKARIKDYKTKYPERDTLDFQAMKSVIDRFFTESYVSWRIDNGKIMNIGSHFLTPKNFFKFLGEAKNAL